MKSHLEEALAPDLDDIADRFIRKAFKSSPWLILSLFFHGLILAMFPLIILTESLREPETNRVTVRLDAVRVDPDRPRRIISSGPPAADGEGLDEPPIFFPDAQPAERNESADKDDRRSIKGEDPSILTHLGEGSDGPRGRLLSGPPGTNDVMGVGGGSGTGRRYGGHAGGRQDLVARGGGSAATEAAVEAGLAWLARHQCGDGHWDAQGVKEGKLSCGHCTGGASLQNCNVGSTALAALAFMAAGYGPGCGEGTARDPATGAFHRYGDTVRAALSWLEKQQEPSGQWKGHWKDDGFHGCSNMYGDAFAVLALCEAARATHSSEYEKVARRGLAWLEEAQNPGAGWQYMPSNGTSDLSVTGACVQALRGAAVAGFELAKDARPSVEKFLAKTINDEGQGGYYGHEGNFPSTTAIGIFAHHFLHPEKPVPLFQKMACYVEGAVLGDRSTSDFYLWYYAMLGLFEAEGPSGAHFKAVNAFITTRLVALQVRRGKTADDACAEGSWAPERDRWFSYGGRAAATAMNVLTLEVYYRYVNVDEPVAARAPR